MSNGTGYNGGGTTGFPRAFVNTPTLTQAQTNSGPVLPNVGPKWSGVDLGSQTGVIRFQPWITLEGAANQEIIQPASDWLAGVQFPTYHMQVEVTYCNGCTLYLESSITPEGPWDTVKGFTQVTDNMIVISSEGGDNTFDGYVRWRATGATAWQTCFQLHAMPGASVSNKLSTPKKP